MIVHIKVFFTFFPLILRPSSMTSLLLFPFCGVSYTVGVSCLEVCPVKRDSRGPPGDTLGSGTCHYEVLGFFNIQPWYMYPHVWRLSLLPFHTCSLCHSVFTRQDLVI